MLEISQKIVLLLTHGILSGIAVVAVAVTWWAFSRRYSKCPKPAAGLLIATAFIIGELIIGTSGLIPRSGFVLFAVVCAVWLIGPIFYWSNLSYVMLPLSAAGIFLTVPDTEDVALLIGILIPAVLFAWPLRKVTAVSRADAAGLAAVIAWVISIDGQGRPASIVVSIGCLGLLAVVPILRRLRRARVFSMNRFRLIPILLHVLSIAIVLGLARTTQRMDFAAIAALIAFGIPAIAITLMSKTYYIEEDASHINNAKSK